MYAAESDKSEKGLYSENDDYGTSYFYRGSVSNNNVISSFNSDIPIVFSPLFSVATEQS